MSPEGAPWRPFGAQNRHSSRTVHQTLRDKLFAESDGGPDLFSGELAGLQKSGPHGQRERQSRLGAGPTRTLIGGLCRGRIDHGRGVGTHPRQMRRLNEEETVLALMPRMAQVWARKAEW